MKSSTRLQGGGLNLMPVLDEVGLQPTGAPMPGPRALPPAGMTEAFGQVGMRFTCGGAL